MMAAQSFILVAACAMLLGLSGRADESSISNAPDAKGFEAFRIIAERNIFNQNRSTKSVVQDSAATRPAPVVEAFSLVGTMSYKKGHFAFFDGTRSEFKKPLKIGDKIAGYEIREINGGGVKIANETNELELKVGQQLRREDESEWQLSSAPPPVESATSESAAAAGASGGSEEEALKRLMEKRAKEMNP